ncbi:MAG: sulfotransferase domain-containing protein [Longimonas sp.]|uniref:sulfotransferase domain-containing protein n=1 Tax=Longimonas sp. TaxID=2039626 RepID=UPI00335F76D6
MSSVAAYAERQAPTAPVTATDTMPLAAFYGHHKCATGWITRIFREMSFYLGRRHTIVHLPRHFAPYASIADKVAAERIDVLIYTNADINEVRKLPVSRGFHVVRDPRDVLVSAYFSHKHSHPSDKWPELEPHRDLLQTLSIEDGLAAEMVFSRSVFEDMEAWDYDQPNVLELHMEALTAHPDAEFARIASFLGWLDSGAQYSTGYQALLRMNRLHYRGAARVPGHWPLLPVPRRRLSTLPASLFQRILEDHRFNRLAGGRSRGEENVHSHYRKGVPGDWRNHFTPALAAHFKKEWGPLLVKLGYESTLDWTLS